MKRQAELTHLVLRQCWMEDSTEELEHEFEAAEHLWKERNDRVHRVGGKGRAPESGVGRQERDNGRQKSRYSNA